MKKRIIGLATDGTQLVYEGGKVKFYNPETEEEVYGSYSVPMKDAVAFTTNEDLGVKHDSGKLKLNLISEPMISGLGEVLTFGANKYSENSWQEVPNAVERYKAALLRHYTAWIGGEELDVESKLHHLKHVLCNAAFLVHLIEKKNE